MTFGGEELYPQILDKVAALGFSLIGNHPFVDGNKRIGHAAMEVTLVLNGLEIQASVSEQEQTILALTASTLTREELLAWLTSRVIPITAAEFSADDP